MNSLSSSQTIFLFYLCCISKLYYLPELHYIILPFTQKIIFYHECMKRVCMHHSLKLHFYSHNENLRKKISFTSLHECNAFFVRSEMNFFLPIIFSHLMMMTPRRCSNRFLVSQLQTSLKMCVSI